VKAIVKANREDAEKAKFKRFNHRDTEQSRDKTGIDKGNED